MKSLFTLSLCFLVAHSFAQYCTTGGPSSTNDSDLGQITLNGQTLNINIPASCPGIMGVQDLTASQTADLLAGNTYTLQIDFNTCGGSFDNVGEAWIDYDLSNTFDSGESLGTWSGTAPSGLQNFTFTVPTWTCNGTSRIRFMQEETTATFLDPCASFTWGAVIDATVTLSGGSCQIAGCTDPTALNYNPAATIDDGSCISSDGADCNTPYVVSSIPFSLNGLNTQLYGNDYSSADACGSVFMNGDDFVLQYIPTADTCVDISISNAGFNTGVFLVKNCPDSPMATCVGGGTGSNASINSVQVEADSTYFIIVSTDGFPSSTNFNVSIQEFSCPTPTVQDCEGATIICQDYFEPNYFSGDGNIPGEVPSGSCLASDEKNAVWYQFTSYQSGFIGFTIFPNTPTDDYDWAVYDITDFGCSGVPSGLSPEVSCDYAPNVCPPPNGDGSTGPNGILTGPCAGQNQPLIPVDSGDTYVIVVSQFTDASQDGFTIAFDTNGVISANRIDALDQTINCGDQVVLDANFDGPVNDSLIYAWSPSQQLNDSTLPNPTTVPIDSTIDFLVTVKNGECELMDTLSLTVEYADFTTLTDTSLCFGVEYQIIPEIEDQIETENLVFTWSPNRAINDVNDSTPVITTFDTITYYVEIINGICVEYDSVTISVTDSLSADPDFLINNNFDIAGVAEVEFYNSSVGSFLSYDWDFGDGNLSTGFQPIHIYADEGTYPVQLKVTDTLGCVDSALLEVIIPVLELPNVFTPNGDDHNEEYFVNRLRPESNIQVYNRWGKLVYESLDYQNDWDGGGLSDGLYFVVLSYQRGAELSTYQGWVEIRR